MATLHLERKIRSAKTLLLIIIRKIHSTVLFVTKRVSILIVARFKKTRKVLGSKELNLFGKSLLAPVVLLGKKGVAVLLLISLLFSSFALFDNNARAATYTFSQSSWAGGASASTLTHPTNQSGWTAYSSSSDIAGTSTTLTLATSTLTLDITNNGTTNTGFNLAGYTVSSTTVSGTGDSASVVLSSSGGTRPSSPSCSGTDHSGADWTVTDNDAYDLNAGASIEIAGDHCNVGAFVIPLGTTVLIKAYNGSLYGALKVVATSVDISGTLNGDGRGYLGGAGGCPVASSGTNTGSYGSAGGPPGSSGFGCGGGTSVGATRGTETGDDIAMGGGGGGGGSGATTGDAGGAGGGSAYLYSSGSASVTGTVSMNGGTGGGGGIGYDGGECESGGDGGNGGAGASGGGIFVNGASVVVSGTLRANGGSGGSGGAGGSGDTGCEYYNGGTGGNGSSGGGGRVKVFGSSINQTGATISATGYTSGTTYNSTLTTITQTDNTSTTASPGVQGGWDNRGASPYGGVSGMSTVQRNTTSGSGSSVQLVGSSSPAAVYKLDNTGRSGNLGGRSGADALCAASSNKPAGATNIKAFISVSGADQIYDMRTTYGASSPVYWYNGSYTLLANNWTDMLDGTIANAFQVAAANAWTGSSASGLVSIYTCNGWTSASGTGTSGTGASGFQHYTDSQWMTAAGYSCNSSHYLRCIASVPSLVMYNPSGTYTTYLDAGSAVGNAWYTFNWNQTANTGSTSVKVKTTSSTAVPSFASGTCDGSSSGSSGSITLTDSCRNTAHRYIWYQATLNSGTSNTQTPTLDSVSVAVQVGSSYITPGTFTSGPININGALSWKNLSWTATGGQTLTMKARSDADGDFSNATAWGSCTNITSGTALSTGGCVTNGHRYIQYQATLSTSDTTQTPSLDAVSISYVGYVSSGQLVSSIYDVGDATNLIGGISWTEDASLPAGATSTVSIRTASSSGGISGASWTDLTNASSNCSKAGGVVTCTAAALPAGMTSSGTNRYFQYKVGLGSSGVSTATISNVTVTYVVNAAPNFESTPTAVQNADGTVSIAYSVRDVDTDTGTYTPGFVEPSFEYSLDGGSSWTAVSGPTLAGEDITEKAVATSTYATYTATWDVTAQFTGQYDTDAKIRVIVDDAEPANNIASSTSIAFTLDTKAPVAGGAPLSVDASQATPLVTLSATDDSALEMKVGVASDLSDAVYESYTANKALALSSGDTVYAQFKDAYNNETAIYSLTPLSAPGNTFYQDTSNTGTSEWREFFAWGVADEPAGGFAQYNVYRSVDGGAYALLTAVTNRLVNYIIDNNLDTTSTYAYKVSVEDDDGNISFFSVPTDTDEPDGVGGSDLASPTLSAVSANSVTTNGATIAWTTNKLSESTVYYSATTTYPGSDKALYDDSVGIPSMVTAHSVVLSGLIPGTQYFFLVESQDASNNVGELASASYTFTTNDGPIISNVTTAEVFDSEVTISWNTNVAADSTVFYSVNSDLTDPVEVSSSVALATNHEVNITGLSEGTKYYYYVQSVDGESNEAVDKNVISGTIYYYSFNTTSDGVAPAISDVTTALIGETGATITWTTSEPSTSQVEWGDTTGLGTLTIETSVYTRQHAVVLTGLTNTTGYYYRVISRDKSDNETTDDNNGGTYDFTTLSPTTITLPSGGGGSNGRDQTKPVITSVSVKALGGTTAVVSYKTSEPANEKIDYGSSNTYSTQESNLAVYQSSHIQYLKNLSPGATYHYRISAADVAGNVGVTSDLTFVAGEDAETQDVPLTEETSTLQEILAGASETQLASVIATFSADAKPLIFGVDVVAKANADSAEIQWVTDKPSNSLVAFSKTSEYTKGKPYTITTGFPDERVTNHKVILENLDPATEYHFQAVSKGFLGAVAVSDDGVFETTSLVPDITDTRLIDITEQSATIAWQTALPSKSFIEIKNTATGEVKKVEDPSFITDHTFEVENLNDSTTYNVKLQAIDVDGNSSDPVTVSVSTALSPGKPEISNLKISTSIIPDRVETTQTIVSWKTNKPATSRILFAEGSKTIFDQSTSLDSSLVREHVVITTQLRPGIVYTISAESGSTGGDVAQSEPYTILTPQPRASVVDLIFENFDTTFGFLKR